MNKEEINKAIEQHELFSKVVTMFINECLDNGVSVDQIQYTFNKYIQQEADKRK